MILRDFEKYQRLIKKDIHREFSNGNISMTIKLLDCYADCTQKINNILRDDELEIIIKEISSKNIAASTKINDGGDPNTVVLYDNIGTTACLCVQYLKGLVACGYRVAYIYESTAPINDELLAEVKKYSSEYFLFDSNNVISQEGFLGQKIRDVIIGVNPSKIVAHLQATGALCISVLNSIRGVKKFRIVPGDHHFYLGYDCFDYFIEFRPFGWSTAIYERNIPAEKIYNLSYYPLAEEFVSYCGLPEATNGKVVLAAGGATYKFQGSNVFYEALETILLQNENAVFVFIGHPSPELKKLSRKKSISGKIFFLGYRKDFVSVMQHVDILINSMPFSGGLFCQTAAYYSKPILAYTEYDGKEDNSVDDILGACKDFGKIEKYSLSDFYSQALGLIGSAESRLYWGKIANDELQTKEQFDAELGRILEGKSSTIKINEVRRVDRTSRIKLYINIRNKNGAEYLMPLARLLKFRVLKYCFTSPKIFLPNLGYVFYNIMASYRRQLLRCLNR